MVRFRAWAGMVLVLLVCVLSSKSYAVEDGSWNNSPYSLGQGLHFPQHRLIVGGYASLRYSDLEQQDWQFNIRDLSLFLSKFISNRWQLFSEIEIGDAMNVSANRISGKDSEIDLERLYADYRSTREINLRFGKFLTPVGRWNVIHADPLVWTVDRPLTTAAAFARHATGAMLYGDIGLGESSLDYAMYGDDSDLLDPAQKNELAFEDSSIGLSPRNAFRNALGGHLAYHFWNDSVHIGVSYLRFKMQDLKDRKELFGADALWTVKGMEFSGEWIYRNSLGSSSEGEERGGFVQGVLPLPGHLYLVGRREKYRAAFLSTGATIDSLELTYRPHKAISVKLEHRDGRDNEIVAPSGWLGSLATLF